MLRIGLLSLLVFTSVWAHKINLFAYDEEGKLFVQSYFTKSSPCKQCTVKLLDANQKELLAFATDDEAKLQQNCPLLNLLLLLKRVWGIKHKHIMWRKVIPKKRLKYYHPTRLWIKCS